MMFILTLLAVLMTGQAWASDYSAAVALHDAVVVLPKPIIVLEATTTMKATTKQVTRTGPLGLRQVTRTVTTAQPMMTFRPMMMVPMAQPRACGPSPQVMRPMMAPMRSPVRAGGACAT